MKTIILVVALFVSFSASAKVLVCDTEIFSASQMNEAAASGAELVPEAKQAFVYDLNRKGSLQIADKKVSSEFYHFSFGVTVKNNIIENIWSVNLDGRVVGMDQGKGLSSLEHLHESDGAILKVNCLVK